MARLSDLVKTLQKLLDSGDYTVRLDSDSGLMVVDNLGKMRQQIVIEWDTETREVWILDGSKNP